MDLENINDYLMKMSHDIPIDDNLQTFINNLGINIDPKKISTALCHKSYFFRYSDKIEQSKAFEVLGSNLLQVIVCLKRFKDNSISNKQISVTFKQDNKVISNLFQEHYKVSKLIRFGNGEDKTLKEFYPEVMHKLFFIIYQQTNFYTIYNILGIFFTTKLPIDYKTSLLAYIQKHKQVPQYETINEYGPDHAKEFEVELKALGQSVRAVGKSKKLAEQAAAKQFVIENNLDFTDYRQVDISPLRMGRRWRIAANRERQLLDILNYLDLDQSKLPYHMLDACFTHNSFLFENKSALGESYDYLSTLGSMVLAFSISLKLMAFFDTECNGQLGRLILLKSGLISSDYLSKLFNSKWLDKLKKGNGTGNGVLESKEVKASIIRALIGAVFLNAFENKHSNPFEVVSKVLEKMIPIRRIETNVQTLVDYNSFINALIPALRLEQFQIKLLVEGSALNPQYTVGLRLFHPIYNDLDFISEGVGVTKKEATKQANKKLFEQLKMNFNLSDYSIYSNSEGWKPTLSNLISLALKPGTFQQNHVDLIGGLCLKNWSDAAATSILNNLYDNMLFTEIRKIYNLWSKNNLSKKADAVFANHPNSNELIELILFEQVIENAQQLEEIQNIQDFDEACEHLNPILEDVLKAIDKVRANEPEVTKEKTIEEINLVEEKKMEGEETIGKSVKMDTNIDISNNQIEFNRNSIKKISQKLVFAKENKEKQVSNYKTVKNDSSKTKEKIETEKIKGTGKNNSETTKLHKIHSRIFRFSSVQCPYCGEDLKNYNRIISVNHKTKVKYIESSAKCCLVCDICGLTDIGIATLRELGFSPQFYQGSPTFFHSTVLTKALNFENIIQVSLQEQIPVTVEEIEEDEPLDLDEILNIPTKRQRVITPETLAKTLEFKNHLGLAGEKFVLDWESGYLEKIGRTDLAKQVIWEAQKNCAAGYDILSYYPDGTIKYIEVKSTAGKAMSFEITANEWEWAKYYGQQYCIYRVFNVFGTPYLEKFENPIDLYEKNKIQLLPVSFRATII